MRVPHTSQSEIGDLAQGIVEIVISIGELQGLKPLLGIYLMSPLKGRPTRLYRRMACSNL